MPPPLPGRAVAGKRAVDKRKRRRAVNAAAINRRRVAV